MIPSSTKARADIDFHVSVTIQGKRTYASIDQLTTIDKERRIRSENHLGRLAPKEMERLDKRMRIFGGLDPS
jgi:mRNA-degrading endonuclease toxin of MazEF toxin-antitoxin module